MPQEREPAFDGDRPGEAAPSPKTADAVERPAGAEDPGGAEGPTGVSQPSLDPELVGARARQEARLAAATAAGKAAREATAARNVAAREAQAAAKSQRKRKNAASDDAPEAPTQAPAKRKGGIPFAARVVLVVAFVAFLFGYDFLATGWGTAPQDQARNAVQQQLDGFASGQDCALRQAVDSTLQTFSADTDDVVAAWSGDLSIKFEDYTRNSEGTLATWQTTLTCKQLSTALTKNLAGVISSDKQLASGQIAQDAFAQAMQSYVVDGFDQSDTIDLHLTLEVRQSDGQWMLTDDSLAALQNALQGDIGQISDAVEASRA